MGAYLDRLNAEYDEVVGGIDSTINRAADENRDVTDDENSTVERGRERLTVLKSEIERYAAIDRESAEVARLRSTAPIPARTTVKDREAEFDVARAFPTVADWAITVHRAMVRRDPEAAALLERATAHQTTADNPGIIPRPVLGPVLNWLVSQRPFINSIGTKPLPAGKFDRPVITQHVAVGVQAAEKTLTESQKLIIGSMPATAKTYAGHLNISRQDIKWTSPNILQIVFDDFAAIYAQVTDNDAADEFVASVVAAPVAVADWSALRGALFAGSATSLAAGGVFPDTLWVSPDVWADMGGALIGADHNLPAFPGLSITDQGGNPMGVRLVVDANFPAATMVMGPSRFAEWYEDVDGLMQVGEPDVLGQLVGYAGYGAFLNVNPDAFTKFTPPAPAVVSGEVTASKTTTSKTA
jgi:hypothetical protein